jgi:hypothetical protein
MLQPGVYQDPQQSANVNNRCVIIQLNMKTTELPSTSCCYSLRKSSWLAYFHYFRKQEVLRRVPIRVRVTLRLTVYRRSIRLGARPLANHDQRFVFQLNPCGNSPYVTSSLTRRRFVSYECAWLFLKCIMSNIYHVIEFCLLHHTPGLCQYRPYTDHAYLTYATFSHPPSLSLLYSMLSAQAD